MMQRLRRPSVWKARSAIACVVAAVVVGLAGCKGSTPGQTAAPEVEVVVATPVKKKIVEWEEFTARLEAVDSVEVRARVGGYLQSIHFREGQLVKKGDLLCVIDPRPYAADVKRAQADLEVARAKTTEARSKIQEAEAQKKETDARLDLARKRMQRSQTLFAKNALSRDDLQLQEADTLQSEGAADAALAQIATAKATSLSAFASVDTAQAALETAQLNLGYTEVRAPISGRVSRRIITEGNLVSGGSTQASMLTTIVSLDPIHCYFDADEASFLRYSRLAADGSRQSSRESRNPVYIALTDEKTSFPHKGHMDFVDNRMDVNTATMRGRAIFRNPDLALTPGLFARLMLPGSGAYEATLVPDLAIISDQSNKYVWVIDADGTARPQNVKIGPPSHGLRVVREGLTGSEKIVVKGMQRVRPGVKVKTVLETIDAKGGDGLPDDYAPVPREEWILRPTDAAAPVIAPTSTPAAPPAPKTPPKP